MTGETGGLSYSFTAFSYKFFASSAVSLQPK